MTTATMFRQDEDVSLAGKPMRVAGLMQFDLGGDQVITRYSLAGDGSAPVLLQEEAGKLAMLRPFPPSAAPEASGGIVMVMGEKYTLSGVRRMKVVGASGRPPLEPPKAGVLLSGVLEGKMGALLREVVPGNPAQSYYLLKPMGADEVLSGEAVAKRKEGERLAAEVAAQAEDAEEAEASEKPWAKAAAWIVVILVIVGLAYACTGSDDDSSGSSSSSHSVRVGGGHGGK
jgi:hypothetical protein